MQQNHLSNQVLQDALSLLKALSNNAEIKIENSAIADNFFSWNQNLINDKTILLPHLVDTKQSRAVIDLAACYLLFHNAKIHQEFSLNNQNLFDSFEKIRVIANAKNIYPGVVKNILQKIYDDVKCLDFVGENRFPLLLLQEIFAKNIEKNFVDNQSVDNKFFSYIKNLAKNISDQRAFGLELKRFLEFLDQQQEAQEKSDQQNNLQTKSSQKNAAENISQNQENTDSAKDSQSLEEEKTSEEKLVKEEEKIAPQNISQKGHDTQMRLRSEESIINEDGIEFKKSYKIYTNKFDEIILPQKLIAKKDLELLRFSLDSRLVKLANISKKLTIKLKKKLLAKKNSYVEQSQIEGILDRKKFTQLIIDPFLNSCFVAQKQREYQDTVVSILLDNSGSMRGQPIIMSALACEIIATILEKFAVKTEILGFTTVDWKGGKARKMWELQGRPKNPGRLSDLRHIVYKSANQNFKKSKINLGLMLKEGILKENIDGEALLWAKGRLMQRDEKRKILAVISDGTPVDDSTNSANDHELLTNHLHHVIHHIEKQTSIEIFGIGIGHQVSNFYRNSIAIKSPEELGDVMIEKITKLI